MKRNCPICKSKECLLIEIIGLNGYEQHPINGPYLLTQCTKCNFNYCNTPVSQRDLDKYYSESSKYENLKTIAMGGGGDSELERARFSKSFNKIKIFIESKSSSILDIGCANGGLLQVFKLNGYSDLSGLDPSPACAQRAKANTGCYVYQGAFLQTSIKRKFDVICLTHVLEHIIDVKGFILKLVRSLKPGGYVYIECPDSSKYHRVIHSPFQEFNTEHINHFAPQDYRNLAKSLGLKCVSSGSVNFEMETGNQYFASYGIIKKSPTKKRGKFETSLESGESIKKYVQASSRSLKMFEANPIWLDSTGVYLYGIGQLSFKIIFLLRKIGIKYRLFDGDSRNIEKKINNIAVEKGGDIARVDFQSKDIIIVTSIISYEPIRKNIVSWFNSVNKSHPKIISVKELLK
jgi:2-polyprenyl-3-methyl-5-hydroxy-6-metoxy-1,4-benzoquinol methylase